MSLRELGVGVVYWPGLDSLVESRPDLVQVIEIEPEAFCRESSPGRKGPVLDPAASERLRSFAQPKLIHGVGFPVGGSRPPDRQHHAMFQGIIRELDAVWASEHLSFNRAGPTGAGFQTGFLLPPLQTEAGVAAAVASIREAAAGLPVPFAVETGVNYLRPRDGELTDGAFVGAVAAGADCGILLDLHNVWTNERNGRQSVEEFLAEIPLERVWEIHLAGGFEEQGYWLDAHSGAIPEPLLDIAAHVIPDLPNLSAVIFEILPTFLPQFGLECVEEQLEILGRLWQRRKGALSPSLKRSSAVHSIDDPHPVPSAAAPREWEDALGALVIGRRPEGELASDLAADPGAAVLRRLVDEFRAGMIVASLKLTARLVMLHRGADELRGWLREFWSQSPPALFGSSEAERFGAFLMDQSPAVPHLAEVLQFELALIRVVITGEAQAVRFSCDPLPLLEALGEFRLPETATPGDYELEVTPEAAGAPASSVQAPAEETGRRVATATTTIETNQSRG